MKLFGPLKSLFFASGEDAAPVDSRLDQQTNVPSRPRTRVSMPSTRSETITAAKPAQLSRDAKARKTISHFLHEHDNCEHYTIEVSDDDEHAKPQTKRTLRAQVTEIPRPDSTNRDATEAHSSKKRSGTDNEEGRLLGDFKRPPDAVVIEIPGNCSPETTMPKPKPKFLGGLKPVNTLQNKTTFNKSDFYTHAVHGVLQSPKRKFSSPARPLAEPSRKKMRLSNGSPDVLQGSRSVKIASESTNNSLEAPTSSPTDEVDYQPTNNLNRFQDGDRQPAFPARPKKVKAPYNIPKPTPDSSRKLTSMAHTEISEEDNEGFTKAAAVERRGRQADSDDDIKEIRYERNSNGSARKVTTDSNVPDPRHTRSSPKRIEELDKILPDEMLLPWQAQDSSPDVIQTHSSIGPWISRSVRKSRTALADARSASARETNRSKTLEGTSTPAHVKLFRARRMLFGKVLTDGSQYDLAVNLEKSTFNIRYKDPLLGEKDPLLLDVPVDRIHRVTHGEDGDKVRIETVELPVIGHEIHLELNSQKLSYDLAMLLSRLGTGVNVQCKPDEWLDKAFEKFGAAGHRRPVVPESAKKMSVESPYFTETNRDRQGHRHYNHSADSLRAKGQLVSARGFDIGLESEQRMSTVERHRRTLQEDLEERSTQQKAYRREDDNLRRESRSRVTRISTVSTRITSSPRKSSRLRNIGEPWKTPLSFPRAGKKKATVNFDDLSRLEDDEFLNDNLIAFFVRFLEHHLEQESPDVSKRLHFFNSYFYEKLRQNPKDKKSINYEGVKKWTDKIGLFSRDFIIVPVNENLHWYVAIICNLSWFKLSEEERQATDVAEAAEESSVDIMPAPSIDTDTVMENTDNTQKSLQDLSLEDREMQGDILVSDVVPESSSRSNGSAKKRSRKRKSELPPRGYDPKRPAIITLDSLSLPRYATVSALKKYVVQEGRERLNIDISESDIQGLSAKKIPTQSNYSDCGLYLCAYLEKFAADPVGFKKKELERTPQIWPDLHSDDLRDSMLDLITGLHDEQEGKTPKQPIHPVGQILIPPIKPERPLALDASPDMANGDETLYDPPMSPTRPNEHRARADDGQYCSDDGLVAQAKTPASNGLEGDDAMSLKKRTAKLLQNRTQDDEDSYEVPESDSEPERRVHAAQQNDPAATAKRLRDARASPERRARNKSFSTEFLAGDDGYDGDDINDAMLV